VERYLSCLGKLNARVIGGYLLGLAIGNTIGQTLESLSGFPVNYNKCYTKSKERLLHNSLGGSKLHGLNHVLPAACPLAKFGILLYISKIADGWSQGSTNLCCTP